MEPPGAIIVIFLSFAGFAAGFVDAVAGGGGLISLPTFLALGLPPTLALGTNKVVGISTALASSSRYFVSGLVDWRRLLPMIAAGLLLSAVGSYVATLLEPAVLRPVILVGLICVGIYTALRRKFGLSEGKAKAHWALWMLLFSGTMGFYDGFFGPGTGTFLMMAFVLIAGQPLLNASANSRVVNLATNLGSLLLFALKGVVDFRLALPAALCAFLGGILGATWAVKKGSGAIRPVFVLVTWMLIAKVAWDLWK